MAVFPKRNRHQRFTSTTLNFGPSASIQRLLTADTTFTSISGGKEGEVLSLIVQQDGTGSRLVTWPASVVWIGGSAPTLATGAWDINVIEFRKIRSSYAAQSVGAAAFAAVL